MPEDTAASPTDDKKISASAEATVRLGSQIVIISLALRIIIGDLAAQGRDPEQAREYIRSMRNTMEDFIFLSKDFGGQFDDLFIAEMQSQVDKLLNNINFASK